MRFTEMCQALEQARHWHLDIADRFGKAATADKVGPRARLLFDYMGSRHELFAHAVEEFMTECPAVERDSWAKRSEYGGVLADILDKSERPSIGLEEAEDLGDRRQSILHRSVRPACPRQRQPPRSGSVREPQGWRRKRADKAVAQRQPDAGLLATHFSTFLFHRFRCRTGSLLGEIDEDLLSASLVVAGSRLALHVASVALHVPRTSMIRELDGQHVVQLGTEFRRLHGKHGLDP